MDINIEIITEKDRDLLNNLLQLYLHDISLYFPINFDSLKGIYEYDELNKYFNDSENYAYFIKEKDNILGFALIDKLDNNYVVQEMFVLNNYKKRGIGEISIYKIFDKHIGNWIVRSLPKSPKAENFWNKTINNYTNGKYSVEYIGKYNRAVFKFSNK